jgi:putative transposase
MSRLRRIEPVGRYFFVTSNLARGIAPFTLGERDICLHHLAQTRQKHGFQLFGYVVMPDHAHLLLATFESALPTIMRDWKRDSGYVIAKDRRSRGSIWQKRYFDFILRRVSDFGAKLQYIHQNPVEASLVERPELWRWSSYGFYSKSAPVIVQPDEADLPVDRNTPLWPAPWT